jgi:transglutaminase-like putative cysteine protease
MEQRRLPLVFARSLAILAAASLLAGRSASADDARGIRLGEQTTSKWRFGVVVRAAGATRGVRATLPVPMDWPEQSVKRLKEEKTPHVSPISYRPLEGGVMRMLVQIPRLAAGDEASAVATFEITKSRIEAPQDTSVYSVPPRVSRDLDKFLLPSPYIESSDPKIKALAAEIIANKPQAWEQTAAIFDWVRTNLKYEFADDIKPATAALKQGQGDCEELSSLVIAMCRASKIPARAIWVPGHTYPEFYLVDDQGKGHWFPCQAAGAERQFGSMRDDRPIIQKGDNFKVPEESGRQRYVKQSLTAIDAEAPPQVKFIMERVKE